MADEPHVPGRWPGRCLGVDPIGGDHQLAGVVEQVIEEDLRRQHGQDRQENGRAGRTEHVAEVRGRGHQDAFIPRPFRCGAPP